MESNVLIERNYEFDILRIIATILVIMNHVTATWKYGDCHNIYWKVSVLFCCIAVTAVPLFFMISGAYFKDYTEKQLFNKIIYYSAVFVIIAFIYKILEIVLGYTSFNKDIIIDAIAYPKYHLWFLPAYVFVLGIGSIIMKYIESNTADLNIQKSKYIFLFFLLGMNIIFANVSLVAKDTSFEMQVFSFSENTVALFPGLYGCFYFALGRYLSKNRINKKYKATLYVLSVVSYILMYKLTSMYSRKTGVGDMRWLGIECFLVVIISVTLFLITKDIRITISSRVKKIIGLLTSCTFGIYLIHPLFLDLFNELGVFNGWQICGMEIRPWINMPLRVVIVFVPSLILSWLILKIKLTFYHRLFIVGK